MIPFINICKSSFKINTVVKDTETNQNVPKSLQVEYKANYGTFDNWMKNNRDHQMKAFDIASKKERGQISLPTGTGKTRVQIALHVSKMIEMSNNGENGVFVIGAHRLALCNQLLTELITVSVNAGLPFDILFVGSDRYPEDKVHCKFSKKGFNAYVNRATSTTRRDEVANAVKSAKNNNRHVIVVSTYHSWHKLDAISEITQATYDEAHTLIGETFLDNITQVMPKIKFNFFFTATRRVQGEHGGMNRIDVFGEVLCEVAPRKMIQEGEIVPPKLHIIQTADEGDFDNHTMHVNTVMCGFEQHKFYVNQHIESNFEGVNLGAKVIISTTGNLEMFALHNDDHFRSYCRTNNIRVFAFSSQEGVYENFEKTSRIQALENMNLMSDEEDSIMLHIDILTEGIDLPAITGIMPFRELNTVKLLQTLGRAGRLLVCDRKSIYSGEVAPMDFNSYHKPCAWVILPEIFRSLGDTRVMKDTLTTIVNTYEIPLEEYNAIDRYLAVEDSENDSITVRDQVRRSDNEIGLTHTIEDIMDDRFNFDDVKDKFKDTFGSITDAFKQVFK